MKLIVADFLRRWWGAYLLAVLFVGAMAAATDLETSSIFVVIFMMPFTFELGRRPVGVMADVARLPQNNRFELLGRGRCFCLS